MYVRKQRTITPDSRKIRALRHSRVASKKILCGVVATTRPRGGCASASSLSSTFFGQFGCPMRGCCWRCRCYSTYISQDTYPLHGGSDPKQGRAQRDVVGGRHRLCTYPGVLYLQFVGQNYQIPSSSLERTLLTGDYLWVNKVVYGPRVPMTPVHFPLVHSSFPAFLGGGKSYMDSPSLSYHRLPGLRDIEQGDIVVSTIPPATPLPRSPRRAAKATTRLSSASAVMKSTTIPKNTEK